MADQSLTDRKIDTSKQLVENLLTGNAPLSAAFWNWADDSERWILYLIPKSSATERRLVDEASARLIQSPFRSVFSISDVVVDARQSDRAQAIGNYVRIPRDIGRRFDKTFTGGQYFEGVVLIYVSDELVGKKTAALRH